MDDASLTAEQLHDLLITLLSGATGRGHWRRAIEGVDVHPVSTHTACNWSVRVNGPSSDREAIDKAVAIVRAEHPYIRER